MSTSAESLRGLFEKALTNVEHLRLALVFEGVAGWLRVRGQYREELKHAGIRVQTNVKSMRTWLDPLATRKEGESPRSGVNHLRSMWCEIDESYRTLRGAQLFAWADEMAEMLRIGLTEHLNAVDALAGLAGLIEERPCP